MAVTLYRKGDTHVVRGVTCESARFAVSSMAGALKGEWVANPKELVNSNDEQVEEEASEEESSEESEQAEEVKEPVLNEVRLAAKAAGIVGYEKKRIATLKNELGYDD